MKETTTKNKSAADVKKKERRKEKPEKKLGKKKTENINVNEIAEMKNVAKSKTDVRKSKRSVF